MSLGVQTPVSRHWVWLPIVSGGVCVATISSAIVESALYAVGWALLLLGTLWSVFLVFRRSRPASLPDQQGH